MIKRKNTKMKPRRAFGTLILTVATFLAFMGIVWQAYQSSVQDQGEQALPIIKADNRPFKVKPDEEGGMLISHRGMSIFETIEEPFAGEDRQENRKTERLVFSKEKLFPTTDDQKFMEDVQRFNSVAENYRVIPMSEPQEGNQTQVGQAELPEIAPTENDLNGLSTASGDDVVETKEATNTSNAATLETKATVAVQEPVKEPTVKDTQKENLKLTLQNILDEKTDDTAATKTVEPVKTTPKKPEVVSQKKTVVKTTTPTKTVVETKTTTTTAKPKVATYQSGNYLIQFGAVRSESGAKQEWSKLQNKLPSLLGDLSLNIEKADLGSKGVYYRIQSSRLSKDDASSVCSQVKASKASDCLVKKAN